MMVIPYIHQTNLDIDMLPSVLQLRIVDGLEQGCPTDKDRTVQDQDQNYLEKQHNGGSKCSNVGRRYYYHQRLLPQAPMKSVGVGRSLFLSLSFSPIRVDWIIANIATDISEEGLIIFATVTYIIVTSLKVEGGRLVLTLLLIIVSNTNLCNVTSP